ncbi:MAG TPA: cytochrome P450 [Pseudonocardiaceae bacterium]|nr:cytochrome P450 [Pseudonocardiaceae bacterium]
MPRPAAELTFDPTTPEFRRDPYRFYRQLRESAPVFRNPAGGWLLSRYRECALALQDTRLGNVEDIRCYPDAGGDNGTSAGSDFAQIRSAVARALSPAVVRRYRPRVAQIVDELVDATLAAGTVDLVASLCHPLGATVFCELFGVPVGDRDLFRGWVDSIVRGVDLLLGVSAEVAARRDAAMAEFSDYFRRLIAVRRVEPAGDLLSDLIAIADGEGGLTEDELVSSCVILLITGHESTVNFVSNSVHALLTHPDELARFRAEPDIGQVAIDELMRYCSPANLVVRTARTAIELDGHVIAEGEFVVPLLAAANRDPDVFAEPERLDLTREPNPHLAFGHGLHYCLGAALARMEGLVALETLTRRAPALELAGEPEFKPTIGLRGLASLPIRTR